MTDDRTYLGHILDSIQRVEEYTRDGRAVFMVSTLIQDAVVRNFEIIGEATMTTSDSRPLHLPPGMQLLPAGWCWSRLDNL